MGVVVGVLSDAAIMGVSGIGLGIGGATRGGVDWRVPMVGTTRVSSSALDALPADPGLDCVFLSFTGVVRTEPVFAGDEGLEKAALVGEGMLDSLA